MRVILAYILVFMTTTPPEVVAAPAPGPEPEQVLPPPGHEPHVVSHGSGASQAAGSGEMPLASAAAAATEVMPAGQTVAESQHDPLQDGSGGTHPPPPMQMGMGNPPMPMGMPPMMGGHARAWWAHDAPNERGTKLHDATNEWSTKLHDAPSRGRGVHTIPTHESSWNDATTNDEHHGTSNAHDPGHKHRPTNPRGAIVGRCTPDRKPLSPHVERQRLHEQERVQQRNA